MATTSSVVVSFVIPLCLLVRTLAEDRAMAAADQEARNVAILVASLHDDPQLSGLVADLDQRGTPSTSVLTADRRVLGADTAMRRDPEVRRAAAGEGFEVVDSAGGRVLLPVVVESGTAVVRSSVTPADLHRGVAAAWAGIIGLGTLLLALALFIASRLGRRVSEPLRRVAGVAHQLREGDLHARAEMTGPEETQELARALNGLAERTVELLAAERASVGDLSHRLRTPVTALRLDAEAVEDPALAARLADHIRVLQRSIDAIVKEARRPVRTDLAAAGDATAAVRARVGFWSALAEDQGRLMSVALPDRPLMVPVAGDDLADLVDVLIDNVFAHTPDGTPFEVRLDTDGASALLVVADSGPGVAPPRTDRVGSTGLGLDIARRTAAGCGGELRLGSPPQGGTRVVVRLPLVTD
ncbi:HAMP domain-containing sensor histidine kinase [Nocardioides sp.]|uniref:HAMP domain-containing sensor histidine kinase n=1 Tax=Nocardioides sp. TaxID=35761 RepID=UPI0025EE134E|nr:HAMP domain-containing sensor histidine kinase [Nocardioides sp.]